MTDKYEIHGVTRPDLMAQLARELPDVPDIDLEEFEETICILHDQKGLSFKQIVDFLAQQGFQTNRSAVYRVYKDAVTRPPEAEEPLVDDETGEVVEP